MIVAALSDGSYALPRRHAGPHPLAHPPPLRLEGQRRLASSAAGCGWPWRAGNADVARLGSGNPAAGQHDACPGETGQTCIASDTESRTMCLAMVSTVRELLESDTNKDPACAAKNANDAGVTNDVIDWIKAHPERAGDDLGGLIREALIDVDPCAQGPLIPHSMSPATSMSIDPRPAEK